MLNKKKQTDIGELVHIVKMTPAGRQLLDEIDRECGFKKTVFHPDSERQTIFTQGKQSIANWLHLKLEKYNESNNL